MEKLPERCLARGKDWNAKMIALNSSICKLHTYLREPVGGHLRVDGVAEMDVKLIEKEYGESWKPPLDMNKYIKMKLDSQATLPVSHASRYENEWVAEAQKEFQNEFLQHDDGRPSKVSITSTLEKPPIRSQSSSRSLSTTSQINLIIKGSQDNLEYSSPQSVLPHSFLNSASSLESFLEKKSPGRENNDSSIDVTVLYGGGKFSGKLISSDEIFCEILFPDGTRSKLLKSQVIT